MSTQQNIFYPTKKGVPTNSQYTLKTANTAQTTFGQNCSVNANLQNGVDIENFFLFFILSRCKIIDKNKMSTRYPIRGKGGGGSQFSHSIRSRLRGVISVNLRLHSDEVRKCSFSSTLTRKWNIKPPFFPAPFPPPHHIYFTMFLSFIAPNTPKEKRNLIYRILENFLLEFFSLRKILKRLPTFRASILV